MVDLDVLSVEEYDLIGKALDALESQLSIEATPPAAVADPQVETTISTPVYDPFHSSAASDTALDFEATFVRDANLPDGSIVVAGAVFDKRWVLRNDGMSSWNSGTFISLIAGECFNLERGSRFPIIPEGGAPIQPGSEVEVVVRGLVAPEVEGTYQSYWKLGSSDDAPLTLFGDQLWIDLRVSNPEGRNQSPSSSGELRGLELSSNSSIQIPFAPESIRSSNVSATPSTAAETPSTEDRSESDWNLHSPSVSGIESDDEEDPFERAEAVSEGDSEEGFEFVYQTSQSGEEGA